MRYVPRLIESELRRAARRFPAVILTGPRRAGKTTLLRRLFPDAAYYLVEDPDIVARLRADPQGSLDEIRLPAIPGRPPSRAADATAAASVPRPRAAILRGLRGAQGCT